MNEFITNDQRFLNILNNAKFYEKKAVRPNDRENIINIHTVKVEGKTKFYFSIPRYFASKFERVTLATSGELLIFTDNPNYKGWKVLKSASGSHKLLISYREDLKFLFDFLGDHEVFYNNAGDMKIAYIHKEG